MKELTWFGKLVDWAIYAPRRRLDMKILWPACKRVSEEQGLGMAGAKASFAFHAFQDSAWRFRYDHRGLEAFIDNME
jgi:hypothetical protein